MTTPRGPRRSSRDARRRSVVARTVVLLLGAGIVFVLGVGLGRALDENATRGEQRTHVRTLQPLPVGPPRRTVTLTVTAVP